MTRITVEVGFGSTIIGPADITYTDITQYVDLVTGISIGRGASDEVSDVQPGTATLVLDNSDGRFTPGNTGSPYSPNVLQEVPIRILEAAVSKNFVTNPTFDASDAYWSGGTIAPVSVVASTTHVQAGTYAALITWATSGTGGTYETGIFGLTLGRTYTASAYVWIPASGQPVRLQIDNGAATGTASSTTGAFERITLTWTATASAHLLQVTTSASPPAAGKTCWLDSVQVEEAAAATAFDPVAAVVSGRFHGVVNEWPTRWKGLYSTALITCTDTFKWLSGLDALQPMLTEEILGLGAVAYYPLAEDSSSATGGDQAGNGAATLAVLQLSSGGTIAFGSGTAPTETGQSSPLFTPSSSSAGKYLGADMGAGVEFDAAFTTSWIEAWIQTSTAGRTFLALTTADLSYRAVFGLQTGTGLLEMRYAQDSTTPIASFADDVNASSGNLANGVLHHVAINLATGDAYVDGVAAGAFGFGTQAAFRSLYVGGYSDGRLWSGSISNVALFCDNALVAADLTAHYTAGATGFAGESADVRVARLAGYVDFDSVNIYGTTFDPVASQGPGGATALSLMKAVETSESGRLFAERGGYQIGFQSRDLRYNPVAAFSLTWADLETDQSGFDYDGQKKVNTVIATRPGGATQRVINAASRTQYGPKQQPLDTLKTSDTSVADAANWLVSRYSDPPPELREVTVEAYSMPIATYQALLDADIGTVFTVASLPSQAPASTTTSTVEGYTETLRQSSHTISFHCSRAYTDSVWVLDDATYSVLGTTTRLAY